MGKAPTEHGIATTDRIVERRGGGDLPCLWCGTLAPQGDGVARVTATGAATEPGKIGRSLQQLDSERSPPQREVAPGCPPSWPVSRCRMSLPPEEFPVILTVFPWEW
jgi:hypothetical protein